MLNLSSLLGKLNKECTGCSCSEIRKNLTSIQEQQRIDASRINHREKILRESERLGQI